MKRSSLLLNKTLSHSHRPFAKNFNSKNICGENSCKLNSKFVIVLGEIRAPKRPFCYKKSELKCFYVKINRGGAFVHFHAYWKFSFISRFVEKSQRGRGWRKFVSQPVWPVGYIIFQSLAIYNNEKLPYNIKMTIAFPQNCAKYEINPQKTAKDFKNFVKGVKFCQIWSHCSQQQQQHPIPFAKVLKFHFKLFDSFPTSQHPSIGRQHRHQKNWTAYWS